MRGIIGGALLALSSTSVAASAPGSGLHTDSSIEAGDFRAVGNAVGSSRVVALGESIHLTREMPLIRLGAVRYLHEHKGFDVLAFEGALVDAWTAQENAYRSHAPFAARVHTFTREALFGLWQTDQMERVVAYALATQATATPLYLTSFDVQPGKARAYNGSAQRSITAFLSALSVADPSVKEAQTRAWAEELGPALDCEVELKNENAVQQIQTWIAGAAGTALARHRPAVHIAVLRLVPEMLRRRLRLCHDAGIGGRVGPRYQETRDRHNAALVEQLLGRAGKLIVWAHHSHIHHNSLGKAVPSMGEHLKHSLGDGLYTLGVFADGGSAVDSVRGDRAHGLAIIFALAARPLPEGRRFEVEQRLGALSAHDFFVDLRSAGPEWAKPSSSRLEVNGRMATALSRDFDGAILLHRVSGAELNFLTPALKFPIRMAGQVLQHRLLMELLAALLVAAFGWKIYLRRRSRAPAA